MSMAEEQFTELTLNDNFYRDSFGKIVFVIVSFIVAILALIALSIYLHLTKPPPVNFAVVDKELRVQPEVPLNQPFRTLPDVLQWVSDTLRNIFVFDFVNYNNQVQNANMFFTEGGWKVFLDQLNIYANYNTVVSNKMFVNGVPGGAPFLVNQGVLSGRFAWWVEMLFTINYSGNRFYSQNLRLQILVVRIPTLNNLDGLAIDNVIVVTSTNPAFRTGQQQL